jgi:hypothetical protein
LNDQSLYLSDIHIPDKQGDLWDGVDPCKNLEILIELAKNLGINSAFTVISGDEPLKRWV